MLLRCNMAAVHISVHKVWVDPVPLGQISLFWFCLDQSCCKKPYRQKCLWPALSRPGCVYKCLTPWKVIKIMIINWSHKTTCLLSIVLSSTQPTLLEWRINNEIFVQCCADIENCVCFLLIMWLFVITCLLSLVTRIPKETEICGNSWTPVCIG